MHSLCSPFLTGFGAGEVTPGGRVGGRVSSDVHPATRTATSSPITHLRNIRNIMPHEGSRVIPTQHLYGATPQDRRGDDWAPIRGGRATAGRSARPRPQSSRANGRRPEGLTSARYPVTESCVVTDAPISVKWLRGVLRRSPRGATPTSRSTVASALQLVGARVEYEDGKSCGSTR